MSEIDRLRRDAPLPDVARAHGVDLSEDGAEFIGCCPFHSEVTPSFTVFRGSKDGVWRFNCFGCDQRGDVVDFIKLLKGVDTTEAIRILGGAKAGPNVPAVVTPTIDVYAGIIPLDPPTEPLVSGRNIVLYNPKRERNGNINPSMVFPYRRLDGSLIGYVLRHDLPDGGKETPSVHWVRLPSGVECWARYPFKKPRPLYGLHLIGDAKQVVVVEGEKCADALTAMRGRPTISWAGGTNGVAHTDWSPLRGKDVIIWPDADGPGLKTADAIGTTLLALSCKIRVIEVSRGASIEADDF